MESKTKNTDAKRRRHSNRPATSYRIRIRNRAGSSFGQPVHIGFYLNPVLDSNGNADRKKMVELFNTESHG
jgi:single-stranded DNA-specific DHH superfamily exonuclease